jgi:GntR family transcriptional repressor for pyruvate dehydrogenase complex
MSRRSNSRTHSKEPKVGPSAGPIQLTGFESHLSAEIKPVARRDVTSLVVEQLKLLAERGVLQPGRKMPREEEMTKLLGISRPSLRQAYKALNILGIIRAVPGDGTYISDSVSNTLSTPLTFLLALRKISYDEVFEFRILVEGELASVAASKVSEEEIQKMGDQLDMMAGALADGKIQDYLKFEYGFHMLIAKAAHNGLLMEIILIVSELLREVRRKLVDLIPATGDDFQQHRDVYEALRAHDAAAACEAMRRHVKTAMELAKQNAYLR